MSKLKRALQHHGIDPAGLDLLFGSGREAVHGLVTDGGSAVEMWRRLRSAAGEIGHWPLILGGDADLDRHGAAIQLAREAARGSAQDVVDRGTRADVTAWLTRRAATTGGPPAAGAWPDGDLAAHHFALPLDPDTGKPRPRVHVGLVPTVLPWQIPAFLRFGGWNACPAPEHHVALLKHWRHAHGAELVSMGGDVLELAVSRPPQDRPAAMRLAREQFVYCADIVRRGTRTLEALAASLLRGTAWYFRWE